MSGGESESTQGDKPLVIEIPNRGGNAWVLFLKAIASWLLVIAVLLVLLFAVLVLPRSCGTRGPDKSRTVQNAKQLGYALFNFENDYGCYPNDAAGIELLKEDGVEFFSSTGGSNYYLSQLIAGGYLDQEAPFQVKGVGEYPDNEQSTADELLNSGEVGFAYVLWDPSMNSGTLKSSSPLLIAYLKKGKKVVDLDVFPSRSSARLIVLRMDMTVVDLKPNRRGVVKVDGKDYFDWSQPHWAGQKPKIVWPE